MSSTPQLQDRIEDLDLRRRMAWGLIGGKTKAEIAEAEGLTLQDCQAVLATAGTYELFNVWTLFLYHRQQGGMKHLLAVVRWCLDFVLRYVDPRGNAQVLGRVTIIGTFFRLSCGGTLRTLMAQLDGATGRGPLPRRLGAVRRKLVETIAWGIETAFIEQLARAHDEDLLISLDRRFSTAMAKGEIRDMDRSVLRGEPEARPVDEPLELEADGAAEILPATAGARPVLRIVAPTPGAAPVLPPPEPKPLLYDAVRYKRRRRPLPPLVQPRLIKRAA